MTIVSSASAHRWRIGKRLHEVSTAQNLDSGRVPHTDPDEHWRSRVFPGCSVTSHGSRVSADSSGIASSMNKSSSNSPPARCYQESSGLVSKSSRCIENTEPVLSSSRLSPDCRLFVIQLFQDTRDV